MPYQNLLIELAKSSIKSCSLIRAFLVWGDLQFVQCMEVYDERNAMQGQAKMFGPWAFCSLLLALVLGVVYSREHPSKLSFRS